MSVMFLITWNCRRRTWTVHRASSERAVTRELVSSLGWVRSILPRWLRPGIRNQRVARFAGSISRSSASAARLLPSRYQPHQIQGARLTPVLIRVLQILAGLDRLGAPQVAPARSF